MAKNNDINIKKVIFFLLCGTLIGLGAVLPGISGGVLAVIFGIYKPLMDLVSNPFKTIKKQWQTIIPAVLGIGIGFLLVSKLLGFLLDRFPDQSVCVFVGLIFGMLPSLFKEAGEKGRKKSHFVFMAVAFAVILTVLLTMQAVSFKAAPNFFWYMFCGFCLALSLIVPGMSSSTFLMPLNLYQPLTDGIGNFDFSVLIPAGIGGLVTLLLLAKAAAWLMDKYYAPAFHAIIGIVVAATLVIIPFTAFTSLISGIVCAVCIIIGAVISLLFAKIDVKKE